LSAKRTNAGEKIMIHEHGIHVEESRQIHDLLVVKIWDDLTEEQKVELMKQMIDGKIMMKENMIELLEHEVETIKMMKEFITKSDSESD